jgi:rhodanese-related sulfurtransferase
VLVDVRPAEEFGAGHIDGAVSIPLDELDERLAELPADSEIARLLPRRVLRVRA